MTFDPFLRRACGSRLGRVHEKHWTIDIFIDEHEDRTRAKARLHNPDETGLVGIGTARLNPSDVNVPEIGDELLTL